MTTVQLKPAALQPWLLTMLRIVAGFTFALYGAKLIWGWFGGSGPNAGAVPVFSQIWIAGFLEFFGGTLIALGLFTRPVAFVLSGEMAVAFFTVHFPQGWNPILNGGEPAVLFSFVFLYLWSTGAGPISIDRARSR